jgi:hypothetical protein
VSRGLYYYGEGTENHQSWNRFLVHKRTISATKRVELVSDLIFVCSSLTVASVLLML